MKLAKCKGCGLDIFWIKTQAGKNMPLDPKPIRVYQQVESLTGLKSWVFSEGYIPHWGTCRKAKDFKKNSNNLRG